MYKGKLVLAPMVRVSELPTRLLALRYGADLVWGPEIVDKKLVQCSRVINSSLGSVDFLEHGDPEKVVFRTVPALERGKLVFQLGSASPELAVQAAKLVAHDVDAIDLNSGCPKHFSIHSGMGAALLKTPDRLEAILRALVSEVGRPYGINISVKIRLIEPSEATFALVRRLVQTGIACLTVHCRTPVMRPREPAIMGSLHTISSICHEAGVACLVNGDVDGRWQLADLMNQYGVDGAMIARAAESNVSCFQPDPKDLVPWLDLAREFVAVCMRYQNSYINTKFCLTRIVPGKHALYQTVAQARSNEAISEALGLAGEDQVSVRTETTTQEPCRSVVVA